MSVPTNTSFRSQIKDKLTGDILSFWINCPVDRIYGDFFGAGSL